MTTGPVTLGEKYRDTITGAEGIAVARYEFLYGCVRIALEGTELKDGKPVELVFDEQRLVGVEAASAKSGGPRDTAGAQRPDPTR